MLVQLCHISEACQSPSGNILKSKENFVTLCKCKESEMARSFCFLFDRIFLWLPGPTSRWALLISPGHVPVQSGKACALRNPFWETVRWIILCTCSPFIFIAWPLNADLAPEGWSYLHLKYPCVYLYGTALSLSTFIVQIVFQCPLQPIKVMAYVVVL